MKKKNIYKIFLSLFFCSIIFICLIIIDIILPRLPQFEKSYFEAHSSQKKKLKTNINYFWPTMYFAITENRDFSIKNNMILPGSLFNTERNLCDEGDGKVSFKSDRFGFRNQDDYWNDISKIDIILLGDSYAQGVCVDSDNSISGILNKKINFKTLNLGISGNSTANYIFLTKLFTQTIKPKYLIVLLYANDNNIYDIYSPYYILSKNLKKEDYYIINKNKISPSEKLIKFENSLVKTDKIKLDFYSKLSRYIKLTNIHTYIGNLFFKNKPLLNNRLMIDIVIKECELAGCKPIFALIKHSDIWDPQYLFDNYQNSLRKYLQFYGKELITFEDIIDYNNKENFSSLGGHLSKFGYSKIVKKLENSLN